MEIPNSKKGEGKKYKPLRVIPGGFFVPQSYPLRRRPASPFKQGWAFTQRRKAAENPLRRRGDDGFLDLFFIQLPS
jgi:hypothetical protein